MDSPITSALQEYPTKGSLNPVIPADLSVLRDHAGVRHASLGVVRERFSDGIMSTIDFTLDVDKAEDIKGDRVKITMCGKFLLYKKS